jgi:hypothetical protein
MTSMGSGGSRDKSHGTQPTIGRADFFRMRPAIVGNEDDLASQARIGERFGHPH